MAYVRNPAAEAHLAAAAQHAAAGDQHRDAAHEHINGNHHIAREYAQSAIAESGKAHDQSFLAFKCSSS